ncbi:hypothetical protein N2597_08045 [Rhizobium sophoriradicis]|uniref:hypothetical protein n=1 Tax=Rhizobium sophoriradicis TaxID=1535245 RepID=UPI00161AA981|nr:hypothetical protein N2597_08045 [Rhizobium leguminosarum bv. phaseoli]
MRFYFTYDATSVMRRVIIIAPSDSEDVLVYCPPVDGQDPWVEKVADLDAAEKLAAVLIKKTGQPTVLLTRDVVDWWKAGLTPAANR